MDLDQTPERRLYFAANDGRVQNIRDLFRNYPEINVNWIEDRMNEGSAAHVACKKDRDEALYLLMNHQNVDVNLLDNGKATPFYVACSAGSLDCAILLLLNYRVDINFTCQDHKNRTPLVKAVHRNRTEIIEWMMASGREVDLARGPQDNRNSNPFLMAANKPEILALLTNFRDRKLATRARLRRKHRLLPFFGDELSALVTLVSDGYLRVKDVPGHEDQARFLRMASLLPMDLLPVVCHMVVDSPRRLLRDGDLKIQARRLLPLVMTLPVTSES